MRAADFMEVNPGCSLRELAAGADLGSASKVVSEMTRTYGYRLRRELVTVPCANGERSRREMRYWLLARPSVTQFDLFPT